LDGDFPDPPIIERDGTSQAGRVQPALDPDYVSVDERSAQDLLVLAQDYAKELRYHNPQDQPAGDWSGFLGQSRDDLQGLAGLVENEQQPAQDGALRIDRPHLALFPRVLAPAPASAGSRQHAHPPAPHAVLRAVLRMSRKPPSPIESMSCCGWPRASIERDLPQDTALRAGKDSLGRERILSDRSRAGRESRKALRGYPRHTPRSSSWGCAMPGSATIGDRITGSSTVSIELRAR